MIRHISISMVFMFFISPLFAQEDDEDPRDHSFTQPLVGKLELDRDQLLPAKDDWNVSFTLPTLGNSMFSGSRPQADTGLLGGFQSYVPTVMVRKFLDKNTAYRGGLQVNYNRTTQAEPVAEDTLQFDPDNPTFVEDKKQTLQRSITLRAGLEKRRGSSRIQGVYGAEAVLGYFNTVQSYEYGNEMNQDFDTPNIHDFGNNDYDSEGRRLVEDKEGNRFLFGVRGFLGAEYFVAPKWSVGINAGYMLGFSIMGEREQTREFYNPNTGEVETVTTKQSPSDPFSQAGLSSYDLQLSTNFYF